MVNHISDFHTNTELNGIKAIMLSYLNGSLPVPYILMLYDVPFVVNKMVKYMKFRVHSSEFWAYTNECTINAQYKNPYFQKLGCYLLYYNHQQEDNSSSFIKQSLNPGTFHVGGHWGFQIIHRPCTYLKWYHITMPQSLMQWLNVTLSFISCLILINDRLFGTWLTYNLEERRKIWTWMFWICLCIIII